MMSLFKQRLFELFGALTVVGLVILFFEALDLALKLLELIHPMVPVVVLTAFLGLIVLYFLVTLIYWLFIEPFRKGRAK